MSQQQPPYPPQQPQPGYYAPPPQKKSHTARNILIALGVLFVLFVGGCFAVVGLTANEIDNAIEEGENEEGGRANPVEITPGEAFSVRDFDYAAGWSISKDFGGMIDIKKLKVTNNRDDRDSALVEIKFWRGKESLAMADCTTEPIEPGTTVQVSCMSADKLPKNYDRITINDSF